MYTVYAIYNGQKIYIGHTSNLEKRIERHNGSLPNKKSSFTSKNKGCWVVIYKEALETRKEAMRREKQLKSYQGRLFIKNIIKDIKRP